MRKRRAARVASVARSVSVGGPVACCALPAALVAVVAVVGSQSAAPVSHIATFYM